MGKVYRYDEGESVWIYAHNRDEADKKYIEFNDDPDTEFECSEVPENEWADTLYTDEDDGGKVSFDEAIRRNKDDRQDKPFIICSTLS